MMLKLIMFSGKNISNTNSSKCSNKWQGCPRLSTFCQRQDISTSRDRDRVSDKRISIDKAKPRETRYLFQRISVLAQRLMLF